jgi:hypothetical protein
VGWNQLIPAIQQRESSTIYLLPGMVDVRPIQSNQVVLAVTVDDGGYRAEDYGFQPRHYDLTLFHPSGQIFRFDHGRVFQITQAQLQGKKTVLVISAPLEQTALAMMR